MKFFKLEEITFFNIRICIYEIPAKPYFLVRIWSNKKFITQFFASSQNWSGRVNREIQRLKGA